MNIPIRCMAAGCGHRFESTASAILTDGRCPRCASSDIDVDEAGLEATASDIEAHGECQRCHKRKVLSGGGVICQDCADAIEKGEPLGRMEGAVVKDPAAIAMDPASEVNQETARCAFCLQTYAYRSADPTEPVPACPHCGSTATTPAGAAGDHTARLLRTASKIEEIALSVLASNPGMSDREAVTIANETVRRYPRVVG